MFTCVLVLKTGTLSAVYKIPENVSLQFTPILPTQPLYTTDAAP
jgi:hypothetical protein